MQTLRRAGVVAQAPSSPLDKSQTVSALLLRLRSLAQLLRPCALVVHPHINGAVHADAAYPANCEGSELKHTAAQRLRRLPLTRTAAQLSGTVLALQALCLRTRPTAQALS